MFKHEKTEYFLLRLADLIQCKFKAKKDLVFFQLKQIYSLSLRGSKKIIFSTDLNYREMVLKTEK